MNILHREVSSVILGQLVGMSAVVPDEADLLVKLAMAPNLAVAPSAPADMSPPSGLSDLGAWFYRVAPPPLNWRGRTYQPGSAGAGPMQNFVAWSGVAELAIHFEWEGEVVISVYERGDITPTWTKTLDVLSANA